MDQDVVSHSNLFETLTEKFAPSPTASSESTEPDPSSDDDVLDHSELSPNSESSSKRPPPARVSSAYRVPSRALHRYTRSELLSFHTRTSTLPDNFTESVVTSSESLTPVNLSEVLLEDFEALQKKYLYQITPVRSRGRSTRGRGGRRGRESSRVSSAADGAKSSSDPHGDEGDESDEDAPVEFVDAQWYYKDKQQVIQGPFSSTQMNDWFTANYFPRDLPIRMEGREGFLELHKYTGNPFIMKSKGSRKSAPSSHDSSSKALTHDDAPDDSTASSQQPVDGESDVKDGVDHDDNDDGGVKDGGNDEDGRSNDDAHDVGVDGGGGGEEDADAALSPSASTHKEEEDAVRVQPQGNVHEEEQSSHGPSPAIVPEAAKDVSAPRMLNAADFERQQFEAVARARASSPAPGPLASLSAPIPGTRPSGASGYPVVGPQGYAGMPRAPHDAHMYPPMPRIPRMPSPYGGDVVEGRFSAAAIEQQLMAGGGRTPWMPVHNPRAVPLSVAQEEERRRAQDYPGPPSPAHHGPPSPAHHGPPPARAGTPTPMGYVVPHHAMAMAHRGHAPPGGGGGGSPHRGSMGPPWTFRGGFSMGEFERHSVSPHTLQAMRAGSDPAHPRTPHTTAQPMAAQGEHTLIDQDGDGPSEPPTPSTMTPVAHGDGDVQGVETPPPAKPKAWGAGVASEKKPTPLAVVMAEEQSSRSSDAAGDAAMDDEHGDGNDDRLSKLFKSWGIQGTQDDAQRGAWSNGPPMPTTSMAPSVDEVEAQHALPSHRHHDDDAAPLPHHHDGDATSPPPPPAQVDSTLPSTRVHGDGSGPGILGDAPRVRGDDAHAHVPPRVNKEVRAPSSSPAAVSAAAPWASTSTPAKEKPFSLHQIQAQQEKATRARVQEHKAREKALKADAQAKASRPAWGSATTSNKSGGGGGAASHGMSLRDIQQQQAKASAAQEEARKAERRRAAAAAEARKASWMGGAARGASQAPAKKKLSLRDIQHQQAIEADARKAQQRRAAPPPSAGPAGWGAAAPSGRTKSLKEIQQEQARSRATPQHRTAPVARGGSVALGAWGSVQRAPQSLRAIQAEQSGGAPPSPSPTKDVSSTGAEEELFWASPSKDERGKREAVAKQSRGGVGGRSAGEVAWGGKGVVSPSSTSSSGGGGGGGGGAASSPPSAASSGGRRRSRRKGRGAGKKGKTRHQAVGPELLGFSAPRDGRMLQSQHDAED